MRIAFNGQRLAGQRLGVGRYIEYHLRWWREMLRDDERVAVFVRQPIAPESLAYLDLPSSIQPHLLESGMSGIPWENLRLRRPAMEHDVLFCPAYTAPVAYRGRLVVATHSVNEVALGTSSWRFRQTYVRLYRHSARQADAVIVPAETTRHDVERWYGVPAERITVIPQGADDSFVPTTDPEVVDRTRRQFFADGRPYILYVGSLALRRNIQVLIEAFAQLRRRHHLPHGLVLFGPNIDNLPLDDMYERLDLGDAVVQTDGVRTNHADLVPIYGSADVFVHPSEYEGWSMTTVEALACGTAVVAANRGGLAEAVAGHGLMVDDLSPESLADALEEVLGDDELRRDLERKAFARGDTLRWRHTTAQALDVVRAVAAR